MADQVSTGEKRAVGETHGGESGHEEGGLKHIYFFIPPTPVKVVTITAPPAIQVTREATQEIQASEVKHLHSSTSPTMESISEDYDDESTEEEEETIIQETFNNLNNNNTSPPPLIQGEPLSQAEGSLQHIYFFIPTTTNPPVTAAFKEQFNDSLGFDIPTIIVTAASVAASKAGTEDGEEPATEEAQEASGKEEEAQLAEQSPTETGNDPAAAHHHVDKKLKTENLDASDGGASSPRRPYHHKRKGSKNSNNNNNQRRTPSPSTSTPENRVAYTSPSGQAFTRQELNDLKHGVKNERGGTVYFMPSFIEDPWANAERQKKGGWNAQR